MIQRFFTFTILSLCFSLAITAQNANDALRFSTFDVMGTGRFVGVGGALGALGTEFSVLSTNPAGLAMYRSSEVVFTPSVVISKTNSTLEGAFTPFDNTFIPSDIVNPTNQGSRTAFTLSNLGFVFHSNPRNPSLSTLNFGVGLNNTGNFNQEFYFEGVTSGSVVERWTEIGNAVDFDPSTGRPIDFEAGPAWDAAAIYDDPVDGNILNNDYELTYDNDFIGVPIGRSQRGTAKGSMNELVLSLATNYNERVMIGMTLGVPFLNYRLDKAYTETDLGTGPDGDVPYFEELTYDESLRTTGAGFNFKLGLLFRATQSLRLGGGFHTPTSFNLNDDFDLTISYTCIDCPDPGVVTRVGESESGSFDYRLSTPWRFFGNAGYIIGKSGFITAELEWVNYSNAKFRYDGQFLNEQEAVNEDIRATFKNNSLMNLRLGGEFAYKVLRFRAGFGLSPTPYEGLQENNLSYSAGLGARFESFFVDFAWRYREDSSQVGYVPYGTDLAPMQFVNLGPNNFNFFVLSLGFRY